MKPRRRFLATTLFLLTPLVALGQAARQRVYRVAGLSNSAPEVAADNFSVDWQRTLNLVGGQYSFTVEVDDGVRLFVDNQLVIDSYAVQGNRTLTATRGLSSGPHFFQVQYVEYTGQAKIKFRYDPIVVPTVIPTVTFTPIPVTVIVMTNTPLPTLPPTATPVVPPSTATSTPTGLPTLPPPATAHQRQHCRRHRHHPRRRWQCQPCRRPPRPHRRCCRLCP